MISMTGFGSGNARGDERHYRVECASVNRKGLEIVVILPRGFASLEPRIREEVQKRITRGRIQVAITDEIIPSSSNNSGLINVTAAHHAFLELKKLQKSLKMTDEITLETLLRIPGILSTTTSESINLISAWSSISIALDQALKSLLIMKAKEGKHLAADLKKRLRLLQQGAKKITTRIPFLLKRRHQQLKARLADCDISIAIDDPGLLRELAFFAEKSDVSEELTRLQSHLQQYQEVLTNATSGGRTLDYLAQEMLREFNTLSNKANDTEVSRWVVESKSELDKIREQLANLE